MLKNELLGMKREKRRIRKRTKGCLESKKDFSFECNCKIECKKRSLLGLSERTRGIGEASPRCWRRCRPTRSGFFFKHEHSFLSPFIRSRRYRVVAPQWVPPRLLESDLEEVVGSEAATAIEKQDKVEERKK